MENCLSAYNRTDTLGKSQLDLILQVYDGAIKTYTQARESYIKSDTDGGFASLEKAQRFMTHLFTTLDLENGGDVAQNLSRMYAYIINESEGVKGTKDTEKLKAIIEILGNIRAGWAGLRDSGVSGTKKAPQPATETTTADGFVVTA